MAAGVPIINGFVLAWCLLLFLQLNIDCPHALAQSGFLNLDCGGSRAYEDSNGFQWTPDDDQYVKGGEPAKIRTAIAANLNTDWLQTVRAFPRGLKNCYTLPAIEGNEYMIRVLFLYGNYDGFQNPPSFAFIIDTTQLGTIQTSITETVTKTFITQARYSNIRVCLGRISNEGIPFISALELRPFSSEVYGVNVVLEALFQLNFGAPSVLRYPHDPYDRVWKPMTDERYPTVTAPAYFNLNGTLYGDPPEKLLMTGMASPDKKSSLTVTLRADPRPYQVLLFLQFFEIRKSSILDFCEFDVHVNGENSWSVMADPGYTLKLGKQADFRKGSINITLVPNARTTLGPILNALDMLLAIPHGDLTYSGDAAAVYEIRDHFNLNEYSGDPCMPAGFNWDWVICDSSFSVVTVASLDLSNKNLNGTIPDAVAKLSFLTSLNMANNNLEGPIPAVLERNSLLYQLNLANNNLSGEIPAGLCHDRIRSNFSGNPYLSTASCKRILPWLPRKIQALPCAQVPTTRTQNMLLLIQMMFCFIVTVMLLGLLLEFALSFEKFEYDL